MTSLDTFAEAKLADLERADLRRHLVATRRALEAGEGPVVYRNGRKYISFSCNDYLNLSQHPAVKAAAIAATETYGTGAGASRLVTGNHPLFDRLEERLALFKQAEAAIVFGSGYLANLGIIPALAGQGDLILVDALSHACIFAGSRLSPAECRVFRHNDVDHARKILEKERASFRNALLVTDGVFSMDGDRAPIAELAALCASFDVWLMSDDAHGFGVLGEGRGSNFASGAKVDVPLQMGTLSKAIGGYGGYLCASRPVIELLKTRARTLLFATGLPPASVAAALAALDIIEHEPELTVRPLARARAFTAELGLPEAQSPIVPLVLGDAAAALAASKLLEDEGFLVVAIRPPTVPEGTARLRFAFCAAHTEADVARLAQVVAERIAYSSEMNACPQSS
ncbi:MAG: 8-amino-7-oxononanoate synthase [Beijerinckiaceae bacterium]|nr:MAG: 8-amino-7-oxononanoate synthase [Beijerinckiaceae bacterium]